MSTNSYIFYEDSPQHYLGVYCHSDGYLTGVGATLHKHYRDREKIKALISLGSLSSLDKNCVAPPKYQTYSMYSRDMHIPGYTFAYHRDREDDLEQLSANSLEELVKFGYHIYLWKDNQWLCNEIEDDKERSWEPLVEKLQSIQEENPHRNYLYQPTTYPLVMSDEEYMETIRRGFLITESQYHVGDSLELYAETEGHHYQFIVTINNIADNPGIKPGYQLLILSRPPEGIAWYSPIGK